MKIEAGKYYIDTEGQVIGPMIASGQDSWPWIENHGDGRCWKDDGTSITSISHNLVKKYKDEVDLSNPYGTVLGMMDEVYGEGTQKAMEDHGGPYEVAGDTRWRDAGIFPDLSRAYRVKPSPKTEIVSIYTKDNETPVAEVTKVDGKIDWSTLKEV
jgi:hypothetical protein